MRPELCALLLATPLAADPATAPRFVEREVPAHVYSGGWEHYVGGGVAAFDCSGDGLPELYVAGGDTPAQLLRNHGDLTYQADTPDILALTGLTGAYPLDIDSDGILDLALLRVGPDHLMRGLGNCQFEPFDLGFASGTHWTTAFSATWESGQTLPTLAFGTYVDRSDPAGPFEACDTTLLYRPTAEGYGAPTPLPGHCALSVLFTDWARRGRADLRVSNDRHYYVRDGEEQLWAMEDTPRLYEAADGWQRTQIWGMGIASRDLSGDGFADVYLTSMGDQKFQTFDGTPSAPTYRDATYDRGTTAHRPHVGGDGRPSTGWHAAFGDVNNDGFDDIFVAKGNVELMPSAAMKDPNSLLMQDATGRFHERSAEAGIASLSKSRGAALMDLDLDGDLDLAVVNRGADLELFENTGATGNWLALSLSQTGANRDAIGAHIELCFARPDTSGAPQEVCHIRERTLGGGHASGQLGAEHFGLGGSETVKLRVIWPDQTTTDWQVQQRNQHLRITRE